MEINWTIIISGCISSAFSSATTLLVMRYMGKLAEHIENKIKPDQGKSPDQADHNN